MLSGPRLHPSPAAGVAAAGLESLRPYLGELYRSRAGAYRDGLREFVLSYREAYDAAAAATPFSSAPGPDDSTDSSGRPEEERATAQPRPQPNETGARTHAQAAPHDDQRIEDEGQPHTTATNVDQKGSVQ